MQILPQGLTNICTLEDNVEKGRNPGVCTPLKTTNLILIIVRRSGRGMVFFQDENSVTLGFIYQKIQIWKIQKIGIFSVGNVLIFSHSNVLV